MNTLTYVADCEARDRHIAASEELSQMERDGLVTIVNVGWGYRRVALTPRGKAQLEERT
jgi:hypothetical protein